MTQVDVDAFVRAVAARYPEIVYLKGSFSSYPRGMTPVTHPKASFGIYTGVRPDQDWDIEVFASGSEEEQAKAHIPWTSFEFYAHSGPYQHTFKHGPTVTTLNHGTLSGTFLRNDADSRRFVRSILWIAQRSRRTNCVAFTGKPAR